MMFPQFVLSDYLSLFVVRSRLIARSAHPFMSILWGCGLGIFVVVLILVSSDIIKYSLLESEDIGSVAAEYWQDIYARPSDLVGLAPGFVVHFWLLLFPLGALGVRLLNSLIRTVEWTQWAVKAGYQNPVRTIGLVAGGLVFVGMAGWKLLIAIT